MYWQYLKYIIRHKWYVFWECCKVGLPLAGLLHDLSKLLPDEFVPYARYFYGNKRDSREVKAGFDRAWNYHQKRNPHHWQYWLLTADNPFPIFVLQERDPEKWLGSINLQNVITGEIILTAHFDGVVYALKGNENLKQRELDNEHKLRQALINTPVSLDMPLRYCKEMLADWRGTGKSLGKPDTKAWYLANKDNIFLHPDTRLWVETQLGIEK